ncbi:MAG: hypothetical protein KAT11_04925 [Phycisphaerae bacterium]|nr:hypothetical protein [Phycisphaerae bacterium]
MPAQETCANCQRLIGALEEAFVWKDNIVCRECYKKLSPAEKSIPLDTLALLRNMNLVLAAIAAFVIVVGVFLPVVKVPIIGSMNYFQNGQGDGVFVIILALIAVLLILNGKRLLNLAPAVLITIILSYFLYNIRHSVAEMKQVADDNIFGGLAAAMADTVQIQFGWFLMLFGNVMLYVAICIKPKTLFKGQVPWWNRISIAALIVVGILVFINQGKSANKTFSRDNSVVSEQLRQSDGGYTAQVEEVTKQEASLQKKHQEVAIDAERAVQTETQTSFFGIRLGESIRDVDKRFRLTKSHYEFTDKDTPATLWNIESSNPAIKEIIVAVYQNRVYQIQVYFSEVSESNYSALKNEILRKYGQEMDLGLDGIVMGGERSAFKPRIDDTEVMIVLEYSSEVMDNELFVKYIHEPLNEKVRSDKLNRKASKFSDEL